MKNKVLLVAMVTFLALSILFLANVNASSEVIITPANPLSFEIKDDEGKNVDVQDPKGRIEKSQDGTYKITENGKVDGKYVDIKYLVGKTVEQFAKTRYVSIIMSQATSFKENISGEIVRYDNGGSAITKEDIKKVITNLPADIKEISIARGAEKVSVIDSTKQLYKKSGQDFDVLDVIPNKQAKNRYYVKKDIDKRLYDQDQYVVVTAVEPEEKQELLVTIKFSDNSEKTIALPVKFAERERDYKVLVRIDKDEIDKKYEEAVEKEHEDAVNAEEEYNSILEDYYRREANRDEKYEEAVEKEHEDAVNAEEEYNKALEEYYNKEDKKEENINETNKEEKEENKENNVDSKKDEKEVLVNSIVNKNKLPYAGLKDDSLLLISLVFVSLYTVYSTFKLKKSNK
ncbi:MAG: hypothetical protein HG467_000095 [Clostridiales bacterium]|nr:hypothetical protein [Clostridiales bacterium]